MELPGYDLTDYTDGTKPYEYVYGIKNPLEQQQAIIALQKSAKELDASLNFKELYGAYLKSQKDKPHVTEFTDCPLMLDTGEWICDDNGVRKIVRGQVVVACPHPILPVMRLINIDTNEERLGIAFKRPNKPWQTIVCDAEKIAAQSKATQLSAYDIAVTSNNAKHLIDYFNEVGQLNYTKIPEKRSASRMGWVNTSTFIPYASDIIPDNDKEGNRNYWQSVRCSDTEDGEKRYMQAIGAIRQGAQVIPRIVLAASLASVLVQPCGALPFICHVWGKTGTGKTVALMLAASVWADPVVGRYISSCNATQVGLEVIAAMLNNLPLILDELQTISSRNDFEDIVYELAEGTNRSRGTKDGGAQVRRTWTNSIITSGEQPITSSNSGGGVVNRVIDMNCSDKALFKDPVKLTETLRECYGYLGKRFVELVSHDDVMQEAKEVKKSAYTELIGNGSTVPEKQAQSASLIIAADYIATKYIFKDKFMLMPKDIRPFLADMEEVDPGKRAYDFIISWINENRMHFFAQDTDWNEVRTQVYGTLNPDNTVTVLGNVFKVACEDEGFNTTSFKRWLKDNDRSVCEYNRLDKKVRVAGSSSRCVIIKTPERLEYERNWSDMHDGDQIEW